MKRQCLSVAGAVIVLTSLASLASPAYSQMVARSESSVLYLDDEVQKPGMTHRDLKVEVGDSTRAVFEPSLCLTGWSGQGRLKVHLAPANRPPILFGREISLRHGRDMTRLVMPDLDHELFVRSDGSFEWQMVFRRQPDTNSFAYPIESQGLAFHYQDELTEDEIAAGSFRADSVIGSYAVYLTEGWGRRLYRDGAAVEFGAGKLCHIYRPKAWDAAGDTVWCDIDIASGEGWLRLTVPPLFLARAQYPVVVDPTFGSTNVGASDFSLSAGNVRHCRYPIGSIGGTADSITVYIAEDGSTSNVGTALYTDDSGCATLIDSSAGEYTTTAWNAGWLSMPVAEGTSLAASAAYYLSAGSDATSCRMKYDDTDSGLSTGHWSDPWPFEATCSDGWTGNDYTFSIYVTYTASGASGPSHRRRRLVAGGI